VPAAANDGTQQIAASLLKDIRQATWIAEGKGPHVAYVFFDPDCPYCHKLYMETRSRVKAGNLQLRWIPAGILTATSPGKGRRHSRRQEPVGGLPQE
jgi:thiol:disulfide interchange protein DsbG